MKLTVKTLKGVKFEVEVDDSSTVEQVKDVIEQTKSELPAAGMKLIHSGKVLKDSDTISSCGIKPNDFLVVMVTKAKKVTATAAPATAATTPTAAAAAATTASSTEEAKTPAPATAASDGSTTATAPAVAPPGAPARETELSSAAVEGLMAMGFPEAEVRHCLRAAHGNPDVAVEFLTNGIPDGVATALNNATASSGAAVTSPSATSSSSQPLQALRSHPQFDALRRLVQSNPAMLQQVLTQIGQQQPELLQEINDNQALFLEMMNEPIAASATAPSNSTSSTPRSSSRAPGTNSANAGGGSNNMMGSPTQMAQLIQNMSAEEVQQMAAMMGLSPEQLRQTAQLIGSMPPEQLQQFMMQAMGGGDGAMYTDDMLEGMGGAGGGGMGGRGGPQVLHLTEEEMAAVDRLAEMGFDRADAAQAFLACDKNEALAANLLMDSMNDDDAGGYFGGGGGGGGNGGGGGGGNGNPNNEDGDDDDDADADDMYD